MTSSSSSTRRGKEKAQPIQVFIRSRPLNKQEIEARCLTAVDILNSKELSIRQQYSKRYNFDKVFGPKSTQLDVYSSIVQPLIPEVIAGYNCTVFAYGQTGTGKTHTMAGGSVFSAGDAWQNDVEAGIIPRALSHLFDELHLIQQHYTVRVSYLELYNEELFDLLSDTVEGKGIRLFEDQNQKGSVIIHGITKETVHNKRQVYEILQKGQEKRRTASTLINAQSSRSHTVFSIMVHTCETTVEGEELVKTGKLNLVDLAGSENISKSGAVEHRAREAGNINQSLLTLGRVIKALVERSVHIPYRESKLTRILQDSLGGRTKTSIIATISPAASCLEETLSTLDYANRARNITNRPEVNQILSQKVWKAQYEKELDSLRKDLQAARTGSGIYLAQENYDRMVYDSEICKTELAEKIAAVRDMEQQLNRMEEQQQMQIVEWNQMLVSFKATETKLAAYRSKLKETTKEKKEQEHLATSYQTKAETLHSQAQTLLGITKTTTVNFRKKIDYLNSLYKENNESIRKVSETVTQKCRQISDELIEFMAFTSTNNDYAANLMRNMENNQTIFYENTELFANNIMDGSGNLISIACNDLENATSIDRQCREQFLDQIKKKLEEVEELTKFVDILSSELCSTKNDLIEQRRIGKEAIEEIKIITNQVQNFMESVMSRLNSLEKKVSQVHSINENCIEKVNKAQTITEDRILKNSYVLLKEAEHIIQENKQRDIAVEKTLEQLQKCKQVYGPTTIIETESNLTVETCMDNLSSDARDHLQKAKESRQKFKCNSDEMQNCLEILKEIASQHKSSTASGLQKCSDNLSKFIGVTPVDIGPGTPGRIPFDQETLTEASPRERILKRFRESYQEQLELSYESLEFEDEETVLVSSIPNIPETVIPRSILRPNILQFKPSIDVEKKQESDKENTPQPVID